MNQHNLKCIILEYLTSNECNGYLDDRDYESISNELSKRIIDEEQHE